MKRETNKQKKYPVSFCFINYKQQQPDNKKQYDQGHLHVGNFRMTIYRAKKRVEFDFHKVV